MYHPTHSLRRSMEAFNISDDPGTLYAAGTGEVYGEMGTENTTTAKLPTPMEELKYDSFTEVASGRLHSLAVSNHGRVWSWGCSEYGALGREGPEHCPKMINHPSVRHTRFKKVACGRTISMALSTTGQLYTWGTFTSANGEVYGYLPGTHIQAHPRIMDHVASIHFVDISAGVNHCLALSNNGKVYTWGCNEYGVLGSRKIGRRSSDQIDLVPQKLELSYITSIACGGYHSLVADKYGQVHSWGLNQYQQCGLVDKRLGDVCVPFDKDSVNLPTLVPYFRHTWMKDHCISEGSRTADEVEITRLAFVKADSGSKKRRIVEVLKNSSSNSNDATKESVLLEDDNGVKIVHRKPNNGAEKLIITLAKNTTTNKPRKLPSKFAVSVAAGEHHSMALMNNNTLCAWGRCDLGQLGIVLYPHHTYFGSKTYQDAEVSHAIGYPVQCMWDCQDSVKKIVCGSDHSLVLSTTGKVWGFGDSSQWQIGVGQTDSVYLPLLNKYLAEKGKVVNCSAGESQSHFIVQEE